MAARIVLMVGTRKGAFVVEKPVEGRQWTVRGPYLPGQNVMHMTLDSRTGMTYVAAWDFWFGSRVYRSRDLCRTWEEPPTGPVFPPDAGQSVAKVWHVTPGRPEEPGVIYAGVEPAALFKSTDDGATWNLVEGLSDHPTRKDWQPGAGGLCLHTIIPDPANLNRLWVAISAAGVFRTDDGGATWQTANKGTRANFMPDEPPTYPEWGQCVHKVALHPSRPSRLFQQNHCGVYRSDDGGDSWTEITAGLPADWGFPLVVHPHEPETIYVCPGQNGYHHWVPGARMAVYRSRDAGNTWQKLTRGLPQHDAYLNVLRDAMAIDTADIPGVYVGTNTGQLYASQDAGDSWRMVPALFPPISSLEAFVI